MLKIKMRSGQWTIAPKEDQANQFTNICMEDAPEAHHYLIYYCQLTAFIENRDIFV